MYSNSYPGWEAVASRKRASVAKLLRPYLPHDFAFDNVPDPADLPDCTRFIAQSLSTDDRNITDSVAGGISRLLADLSNGRLTAVDAVEAFSRRAALGHIFVNCLSEVLFEQAVNRARELDEYLQQNGKPVGPLHGLPVSVKDQFRVKDAETSLGYVGWLGHVERAEDESLIIKHLESLGAIIIAKTNVPTSLMAMETDNNIMGYTLNPHNRLLSSGGSSGGEAALLALKGSALGLGSDIAASIRLPASINGIYGLKPSHGRLPYFRVANSMEGQEVNNSVIGPMGHSVEDIELFTRLLVSQKPWLNDPTTLPMPWRQQDADEVHRLASRRQLTFAVLKNDGIVLPHPPIQRTMDEVTSKLIANGHNVVEWDPPHHGEAFSLLLDFFTIDGGADVHAAAALSGEPLIPQLSAYYGTSAGTHPVKSLHDTWEMVKRRKMYQTAYLAYWNSTAQSSKTHRPVDFVILPCSATPSFRRNEALYPGYTGVASILNFTSVVVPAAVVNREKDPEIKRETFFGDLDRSVWMQYDPELFHNTPIGIQIMGRQLEEERVLASAVEVQRCLQEITDYTE